MTLHVPSGEQMSIYDAAMRYKQSGTPLIVIAGKEYGTGSSRDWAAKGTMLLGVRAVIAESFERIHRSNLIGMGVLPLQFRDGENAQSLGLTGQGNLYDRRPRRGKAQSVTVTARPSSGKAIRFTARVRNRYAKRARLFPPRRDPPLCAAATRGWRARGVKSGAIDDVWESVVP